MYFMVFFLLIFCYEDILGTGLHTCMYFFLLCNIGIYISNLILFPNGKAKFFEGFHVTVVENYHVK